MKGCYAVCHKQLGDLLLLEPAFEKLKAHHGTPVRVLTRSGHRELLNLMPGVVYQRGWPRSHQSDLYCFDSRRKSVFRSWFSPSGRKHAIVPDGDTLGWFHRRVFHEVETPALSDRYVAEFFWRHTPVPSDSPFRTPKLQRPPEEWKVDGMGKGAYILLSPTSGWAKKMWTVEGWVSVMKALHERCGVRFALTSGGTEWQKDHCKRIVARAGPIARNLSNRTTLKEFLWLISRAEAVLSVDGATSHLAQALGIPALTLFGPTSQENWHQETPSSIAVQAAPSKNGRRLMRNLDAAMVLEALERLCVRAEETPVLHPTSPHLTPPRPPIPFSDTSRRGAGSTG